MMEIMLAEMDARGVVRQSKLGMGAHKRMSLSILPIQKYKAESAGLRPAVMAFIQVICLKSKN